MARYKRYVSYAERIAKARKEADKKKLMAEAEALYGKSYIQEYNELMTRAEKRKNA